MKNRLEILPRWGQLIVGLLIVTSGQLAAAQVPPAVASCDADDECNRLANEAIDASQAGHFDDAQRAYKAAYARQPDPKLLFNLARVLHKSGQFAEAVTYYQKYLDAGAEGNAEQQLKAQQRIEEARRDQAAAKVKPAPPPEHSAALLEQTVGTSPATPDSSRGTPVYRKWWLWTAVGVVVAGVAVGAGLGLAARRPDITAYYDAHIGF